MAQGLEHVPTDESRELVAKMAGFGLPLEQIGALVGGINRDTVARHYSADIERGRAEANSKVGRTLFQKATEDRDTAALIWWTKSQMRWKGTDALEHTGKDGESLPAIVVKFGKDDG